MSETALVCDSLERRRAKQRAYYYKNKEATRAQQRAYYNANRDARLAAVKRYKEENTEKVTAAIASCWERNREKYRAREAEWRNQPHIKERRSSADAARRSTESAKDRVRARNSRPASKLASRLRTGMRRHLAQNTEWISGMAIVGYSISDLRAHLERQFQRGMSWENMDLWHVDHIVPLSAFDFAGPNGKQEFKSAWALSNLRPLLARDNLRKHAKRETLL